MTVFLLSLAGIVGAIVFLLAGFLTIPSFFANPDPMPAVVFALVSAAGLALAIGSNRLRKRRAARQEADRLATADAAARAEFRGADLTIRPRWLRGISLLSFFALFTFGVAALARTMWMKGNEPKAVLLAAGAVLGATFVGSILYALVKMARAGYALHLDLLGLSHSQLPVIAWKGIRGVAMQEQVQKGQRSHSLVLCLDRDAFFTLLPSPAYRWLHWLAPRFNQKTHTVTMPCALMDAEPALIARAAQSIADRAGAPRVKSWMGFEPIELAAQRDAANATVDEAIRTIERLHNQIPSAAAASDANALPQLETRFQSAMARMNEASDAAHAAQMRFLDARTAELKRASAMMDTVGKWFVAAIAAVFSGLVIYGFVRVSNS